MDDEPPPSGDAAAGEACELNDLPDEMLTEIAGHLPMRSLQALACVNKRMGGAVASERKKIELISRTLPQDLERFSWGSGLLAFQRLLSTIRRLHPDDQRQPLQALCARLDRLRTAERKQAAEALLERPCGLSKPRLNQLEVLARFGSPELAVMAGEPVDVIANRCNIDDVPSFARLALRLGPTQAAIDAGEDREAIATRHGVPSRWLPRPSTSLDMLRDLTDPSLYHSREASAGRAVYQGEHIDTAVNRCFEGGEMRNGLRYFLESVAVDGVAGEAAAQGEHVEVIAKRHGINGNDGRLDLERHACKGAAAEEADAGDHVAAVAKRHGIRSATYRLALMRHAMAGPTGDDVRTGRKTVEQVAHEQGIDLAEIERIGIAAWRLPEIRRMQEHGPHRRIGPTEFLERGAKSGERPAESVE